VTEILKVVVLLVEFGGVNIDLLYDSSQVILLGDQLVRCLKFSQFLMLLSKLQICYVNFGCKLDFRILHHNLPRFFISRICTV
jgi:hypothetical protein